MSLSGEPMQSDPNSAEGMLYLLNNRYRVAYSRKYGQYVRIILSWIDDSGKIIVKARVAYSDDIFLFPVDELEKFEY